MTNEELRLWCDAQGMSYPGTVSGLLAELVKQCGVQRDIGAEKEKQTARVYGEFTKKLDELGVASSGERPFNAIQRLQGLLSLREGSTARAIAALRLQHPELAEGEDDASFLTELGSVARALPSDREVEQLSDHQLGSLAGLAAAELLARRIAAQKKKAGGGGLLGFFGSQDKE